ncbi:uncharacterized protein EAF01_008872 [Botrytis porri]|uniref:uncharacterized protein n=1 Tax=Botrytis porri TaxID=87229 RepID=UPI0019000CA3|nr:uncharacterized protein EAF01_008872 [Botrytis porri]KAF7897906.1 hypothetical protein EAF01_008872 [Botrytis porri]
MINFSKFHDFTAELQSLILKRCERRDLTRLSQTSRDMYERTVPILYRHVNLSSHRTTSNDLIDLRGFAYTSLQHKDNVKRQNAFIDTILKLPTLGYFVLTLTWTIYPRQCSDNQKCEDNAKMWEAWKLLFRVKRLDIYSFAADWGDFIYLPAQPAYEDYLGPSAIITPAVFPEATVIRIGGLMPYNYFRACVSTPSIVASLEMENLQGLLQLRDGCNLSFHVVVCRNIDHHFWRNQTRYKETKDESGIPVLRHAGPMRGHLQPLVGKFVRLEHLKISTAGREVSRDVRWSETREKKRYSEMANFIKSVAPKLVTFAFEQGVGLEPLQKWQLESYDYTSTSSQSRRPMDDYFLKYLLPALLEGTWSQLRKFSIQGVCGNVRYETRHLLRYVNFTPEPPEALESVMYQLRSVMSNSVALTLERETQRVFHTSSFNVYRTRN